MKVLKQFTLAAVFASLVACGGGESKVGKQEDAPPQAVASVFGSNIMTDDVVEVRSGSEVLLSGQTSDGIDDPILTFKWTQIDSSGYTVGFYERTSNAVVFTAPKIPVNQSAGIELEFELTIEDGDGVEATDTVSVRVIPSNDANHFLLKPEVEEKFALIVTPDVGETLGANVPVSVNVSYTIDWLDRSGNPRSRSFESTQHDGAVMADALSVPTDPSSLYFMQSIPLLDFDEVNQFFQGEDRAGRLEIENVNSATLTITAELSQRAAGDLILNLGRKAEEGLEVIDTTLARVDINTLRFTAEWIRNQVGVESLRTGQNYYDCIDPNGQSATFQGWLEQAGFNAENADSIHHTAYVNNFDLNFGRDMWVRSDENGNVYSYVTNYPSLENTLSRRNDFAIVVMEFSEAPTGNCGDGTFSESDGGEKIVKFYSYIPDKNTGVYLRVPTMNFDGRGERAVPGVCVACHFGDTNTDDFNAEDLASIPASAANLDSSFIAWDLDAFLFTVDADSGQIDPVYSANEISPELTNQFSREAQEATFRAQNQAVLDTFVYDPAKLKRYETAIKFLHGLYGNAEQVEDLNFGTEDEPLSEEDALSLQAAVAQLPANNFDGKTYVPSGWQGQEELYHRVYSRNCRLCHVQISNQSIDFDTYEEFITNERLVTRVYEEGVMPLSRLTMDRFWTDFYGNQSAAEFLRDHLNSDNNPNNDVAPGVVPGYPVAVVSPGASPDLDADITLDFGESVLFDATDSLFSNRYQWRVNGVLQSSDSRFTYVANNPGDSNEVSLVAFNTAESVTSNEEVRRISVANNVPSAAGVPNQTVAEGESIAIDIFGALCSLGTPDSPLCRSAFGDIAEGEVPLISVVGEPVNGEVLSLDTDTGILTFASTAAESEGAASFDFTITDSFGETSDAASVLVNVNSLDGPTIGSPDTCRVDALTFATELDFPQIMNSAECLNPILNDTVADGLTLSIASVNGASLQDDSSVSLSSGLISYTPSPFFVGQESFLYTAQDDSLSAKTSEGTVVVTVSPTVTYTDLNSGSGLFNASGDAGCADCHDGNTAGAPNWQNVANVQLAVTNSNYAPYGAAEITLAAPTTTEQVLNSIFFKNGCDFESTHLGGNRLCNSAGAPASEADLNAVGLQVLEWVEQGARDN